MRWAKVQHAELDLGQSGMAPPPPAILPLAGLETELAQQGYDMPPALRRGLADWWGVTEERLMLTLGTSHAFYLLAASRLSRGDACLVELPTYEMLRRLPVLFGADVQRFTRSEPLAERVAAQKPAMLWMSNPHNPSGVWLDDLSEVSAACAEAGTLLCIDEVYLSYLPDPGRRSSCRLGDHVAVASSFTKAFGLGTVRCGWLVAAPAVIGEAIDYNDYISVLYPNPNAWVGLRALAHKDALAARADQARRRGLALVDAWIAGRDDVSWQRPNGGIIGLLKLHKVDDTFAFVNRLLDERQTKVVPGEFFEAPGHVRLGFGIDVEILREGLERLGAQLDSM